MTLSSSCTKRVFSPKIIQNIVLNNYLRLGSAYADWQSDFLPLISTTHENILSHLIAGDSCYNVTSTRTLYNTLKTHLLQTNKEYLRSICNRTGVGRKLEDAAIPSTPMIFLSRRVWCTIIYFDLFYGQFCQSFRQKHNIPSPLELIPSVQRYVYDNNQLSIKKMKFASSEPS